MRFGSYRKEKGEIKEALPNTMSWRDSDTYRAKFMKLRIFGREPLVTKTVSEQLSRLVKTMTLKSRLLSTPRDGQEYTRDIEEAFVALSGSISAYMMANHTLALAIADEDYLHTTAKDTSPEVLRRVVVLTKLAEGAVETTRKNLVAAVDKMRTEF